MPPTPPEWLHSQPHNLIGYGMFNCEKVLFVLVCEIHFWVSCFCNEQDGRFEQCNPVRLAQCQPHLFQTQIEEYFYDLNEMTH